MRVKGRDIEMEAGSFLKSAILAYETALVYHLCHALHSQQEDSELGEEQLFLGQE